MATFLRSKPSIQSISVRRATIAGWTLVELMIVLTIAALLLLIAVPSYFTWLAEYQLLNHARLLAGSMNVARSEAIKRGYRVNLCRSSDQRTCGGSGWQSGWLVYVDENRDGDIDVDEPVLHAEPPPTANITVTANAPLRNYVSYTPLGSARLLNGALQMGTFSLCRPGTRELHVVLANSGRVRIEKTPAPCP